MSVVSTAKFCQSRKMLFIVNQKFVLACATEVSWAHVSDSEYRNMMEGPLSVRKCGYANVTHIRGNQR